MISDEQVAEMIRKGQITFYGLNVVAVDRNKGFQRDVTLITVEVPNEALESISYAKPLFRAL